MTVVLALALSILLVAGGQVGVSPAGAQADEGAWPSWHGGSDNARQGTVDGPADPGIRWVVDDREETGDLQGPEAPEGFDLTSPHHPILAPDGTIIVRGTNRAVGGVGMGNAQLIGIDPADGSLAWNLPFVHTSCMPAIDSQGRVWVQRDDGAPEFDERTLQAIDGSTGEPIAGSEIQGVPPCGGTPLHIGGAQDHVAWMDGGGASRADTLAVYDISGPTAVEAWTIELDDTDLIGNADHPAIAFTDDSVIVPRRDTAGAERIAELVEYPFAAPTARDRVTLPVLDDDPAADGDDLDAIQLLTAADGTLVVRAGVFTASDADPYLARVDVAGGLDVAWTTPLASGSRSSQTALGQGVAITASQSGTLTAFALDSGDEVWTVPSREEELITDASGNLYTSTQWSTDDGGGAAVSSYSADGQLRWEAPVLGINDVLGRESQAERFSNGVTYGPIASDGTMYLFDSGKLLAIDDSGGLVAAGEPQPGDPGVSRIDGDESGDPGLISIEICDFLVEDGTADSIALARIDDFADALAGSALPVDCILFTEGGPTAPLNPDTRADIQRALGASGTVFVLGGANAVSEAAASTVAADGYSVERLEGPTRFETAEAVATTVHRLLGARSPDQLIVAFGGDWADAVTAGAYAHATTTPIVLTPTGDLHPAAARVIDGARSADPDTEVIIVGGPFVVGPEVEAAIPGARRVAGDTRMSTAVAIAEQLWPAVPATGTDFVLANLERGDAWTIALASAPLAATLGGPQLGLRADSYPDETRLYLRGLGLTDLPAVTLLGDVGFISEEVAGMVDESITPQ